MPGNGRISVEQDQKSIGLEESITSLLNEFYPNLISGFSCKCTEAAQQISGQETTGIPWSMIQI